MHAPSETGPNIGPRPQWCRCAGCEPHAAGRQTLVDADFDDRFPLALAHAHAFAALDAQLLRPAPAPPRRAAAARRAFLCSDAARRTIGSPK